MLVMLCVILDVRRCMIVHGMYLFFATPCLMTETAPLHPPFLSFFFSPRNPFVSWLSSRPCTLPPFDYMPLLDRRIGGFRSVDPRRRSRPLLAVGSRRRRPVTAVTAGHDAASSQMQGILIAWSRLRRDSDQAIRFPHAAANRRSRGGSIQRCMDLSAAARGGPRRLRGGAGSVPAGGPRLG